MIYDIVCHGCNDHGITVESAPSRVRLAAIVAALELECYELPSGLDEVIAAPEAAA